MKQKTHTCVLASTSAGNCTVIWNDAISILVDCGMNLSYTEEALQQLGLSLQKITAVFITHCHGDHVNQAVVKKLVEYGVPIYCHTLVARPMKRIHRILQEKNARLVIYTEGNGQGDGFSYTPFSVPHDSDGGCFGYSFFLPHEKGTHKVSIATDIGHAEPGLVGSFVDSDIIIIESNHDVMLLQNSSRPKWLKDRIVKIGHLSNDQSSAFIQKVLDASAKYPVAIILAHISQECNTNSHAKRGMHSMLAIANKSPIAVIETHKERPSMVVSV